ncbi:hypothetical protein J7E52_09125 [Bacillus sp. ISL-34]|uniref:hypothetical protein n=1 Tax=Bacillus sp. ISL-34 TaxID=2819121 RepID=UPI001BE7C1B3|nr:hypothetical protein [Bacillus sp. ISL-34]MBT2646881.1 hypothetical protein [Bacillus sp. ISL-34]
MQLQNHRIQAQKVFFVILVFYTFCFSNIIRLILGDILKINLLYSIILPIIIILYIIFFQKKNYFILYIMFSICALQAISIIYYQIEISNIYRFVYGILSPLLLIGIRLERTDYVFRKFLNFYNWLIILNVIYGLIDYLSGKKLQLILGDFLYFTSFYDSIHGDYSIGVYRLFSLLGHPLTNMLLLLIFLCFNLANRHYLRIKTNVSIVVVYLITILGMILCNSKLGIALTCIILLSTLFIGKKKYRNFIYMFIPFILVLSNDALKQNVLQRFINASDQGDITNGRFSAINSLLENGVLPNMFIGRGIGSSDSILQSVSNNLSNIEIPLVMFMFDYGIFTTFLFYILIYFFPAFVLLKNRHLYLFFLFNMIFLFSNSYNGLAVSIGIAHIAFFSTMMILNLSIYLTIKRKI